MKHLIFSKSISMTLVSLLLFSCHPEQEKKAAKMSREEASFKSGARGEESVTYANNTSDYASDFKPVESAQNKKLIKTGNMTLKTRHIEQSKAYLDQALRSVNGYYDRESFTKSDDELRYSLKLRIPSANFDQLLQLVQHGSDEILSKNIRAEDVSEEYNDTETRLKSKRAYLQRYQEIMNKAKNVDELLQIEAQVRQLIEEIESQEGRLRFLDNQSGYGTLNIELFKILPHRAIPPSDENGFGKNAVNSFSTGWHAVTGFVLWLLSIWPLVLILVPGGIFAYKKLKVVLKKQENHGTGLKHSKD